MHNNFCIKCIPLVDDIDKIILSHLGKNARISSQQIAKSLHDLGYTITDRAVRQRLQRLEKKNMILGYSAILNPATISRKVNRTILLKFKYSKNVSVMIERLTDYVDQSSFCVYSARLSGDFDWVCHFVFDSIEQYELESNNFLNIFADLIADFRTYESKMIKSSPYMIYDEHDLSERKRRVYEILRLLRKYDNLNDRLQAIVENVVKYFDGKFARVWFIDKERKWLVLKFSAGKYKNINGEFSKVSIDSLKIGVITKTGKAQVSNDVVHDPRIRYPEWAKKEKLRSFAGYPLMYKGQSLGVLAMFSEKRFTPLDFELLGIFCEQISKELAGFFEAQEFLADKLA